MNFLSIFSEIVWIAAGLAVFASVVLFVLAPVYSAWSELRSNINTESELYDVVVKALDEFEETGNAVTIIIGDETAHDEVKKIMEDSE